MHHRKDKQKCDNKRLINRAKVERSVIQVIQTHLQSAEHIKQATDIANNLIRKKMRVAPDELKRLQKRKDELNREINNLVRVVSSGGDFSFALKEALQAKENENRYVDSQIRQFQTIKIDKLFFTPFAMKAKFDRLADFLLKEPVIANAALRRLSLQRPVLSLKSA